MESSFGKFDVPLIVYPNILAAANLLETDRNLLKRYALAEKPAYFVSIGSEVVVKIDNRTSIPGELQHSSHKIHESLVLSKELFKSLPLNKIIVLNIETFSIFNHYSSVAEASLFHNKERRAIIRYLNTQKTINTQPLPQQQTVGQRAGVRRFFFCFHFKF